MLFIYLVFCLFLFAYQSSCSQISQESSDFDLNTPDLTTSYETDQKQFQIEAYKSSLNDKLFENNQIGFHKQLKWISLGNPQTTQNKISCLFHDFSDGFYNFIQILSNYGREIANQAKELYGIVVKKYQILIQRG